MKLQTGDQAPEFVAKTVEGRRVSSLDDHGDQLVLLKFYRFASCPICNLHLRTFAREADKLRANGIVPIVFFHSDASKLERQTRMALGLDMVADPKKALFHAYGVESSWRGMFSVDVMRDYAKAMAAGFFTRPFGHEGGMQGHPADFLIDRGGVIRFAHYGKDYADSLTAAEIIAAAASPQTARQEVVASIV